MYYKIKEKVLSTRAGEGNFSSRWARYGKIKYFEGRIIIYSQSEILYTVSWIQSAGQSKALHGPDLACGPYVVHPCIRGRGQNIVNYCS